MFYHTNGYFRTGGLAGVAIAVQPIFHIDPQLVIYALTFIPLILGWLFLGKGFAAKTMPKDLPQLFFVFGFTDRR